MPCLCTHVRGPERVNVLKELLHSGLQSSRVRALRTNSPDCDDTGDPSIGLSVKHEQGVNINRCDQSLCNAAELRGLVPMTFPRQTAASKHVDMQGVCAPNVANADLCAIKAGARRAEPWRFCNALAVVILGCRLAPHVHKLPPRLFGVPALQYAASCLYIHSFTCHLMRASLSG